MTAGAAAARRRVLIVNADDLRTQRRRHRRHRSGLAGRRRHVHVRPGQCRRGAGPHRRGARRASGFAHRTAFEHHGRTTRAAARASADAGPGRRPLLLHRRNSSSAAAHRPRRTGRRAAGASGAADRGRRPLHPHRLPPAHRRPVHAVLPPRHRAGARVQRAGPAAGARVADRCAALREQDERRRSQDHAPLRRAPPGAGRAGWCVT